jgi:hypothetical protein
MHVRWQAYRSQARALIVPGAMPVVERLTAVLVESIRVDGKPRQKPIAFVGSIASDDAIGRTAGKRFWRDVISKLKRLGHRVAPEEYECIVAAIAAKVGGGRLRRSLSNSSASASGSCRVCRHPSRLTGERLDVLDVSGGSASASKKRPASTPNCCSSWIRKR